MSNLLSLTTFTRNDQKSQQANSMAFPSLAQRVQALPNEVICLIQDLVFAAPTQVSIDFTYRPPAHLQVDKATRCVARESYYRNTTFVFTNDGCLLTWLRSWSRTHRQKMEIWETPGTRDDKDQRFIWEVSARYLVIAPGSAADTDTRAIQCDYCTFELYPTETESKAKGKRLWPFRPWRRRTRGCLINQNRTAHVTIRRCQARQSGTGGHNAKSIGI